MWFSGMFSVHDLSPQTIHVGSRVLGKEALPATLIVSMEDLAALLPDGVVSLYLAHRYIYDIY